VITDVDGVEVGHWSDPVARTGCTVVLLPPGTVASGEVRGGAPATREFDLLDPRRLVSSVDAVVVTGGSAFGLASADGVTAVLEARGRGYATVGGVVPIVVAMALYDLAVGDGTVRPGASEGAFAATTATGGPYPVGVVGAGAGATTGKWHGRDQLRPGGLTTWTERAGDLVVSALVAVNAWGDVAGTGLLRSWPEATEEAPLDPVAGAAPGTAPTPFENTTIGLVVTNARLDKLGCRHAAEGAHDGLARAVLPTHTAADGDAFVAAATGQVEASPGHVRYLATLVVERAIRSLGA
jgi:L-aminopeptidase/D-esterase-like protein